MKKRHIRILLGLLIVVVITSCKSAPEEPAPEPEPVVEVPATPTSEPIPEPVVEEPEQEVVPVISMTEDEKNELMEKIAAARKAAVEASADVLFADEFAAVEAACSNAFASFDADGDAETLKIAAKDIIRMYKALENAALAESEFNRIVELGFDSDNPAAFDTACDMAMALREMAESGATPAELLAKSEELLGSYRSILDASFKKRADAKREEYVAAEKQAKSIKAEVAGKDKYNAAHQLCVDGDAAYARTSYEHALYSYTQATEKMTAVFTEISQKRAQAEAAMAAARERAAAAEKTALEADELAPLPADAEGFDEPEETEEVAE